MGFSYEEALALTSLLKQLESALQILADLWVGTVCPNKPYLNVDVHVFI